MKEKILNLLIEDYKNGGCWDSIEEYKEDLKDNIEERNGVLDYINESLDIEIEDEELIKILYEVIELIK